MLNVLYQFLPFGKTLNAKTIIVSKATYKVYNRIRTFVQTKRFSLNGAPYYLRPVAGVPDQPEQFGTG